MCSILALVATRMSARGDEMFSLRIALRRKGAGKKMLIASRFTRPLAAGWARARSSSIDEHAAISARGGTTTWRGWRAAVASMMTGVALWPTPRRQPILSVGRRTSQDAVLYLTTFNVSE